MIHLVTKMQRIILENEKALKTLLGSRDKDSNTYKEKQCGVFKTVAFDQLDRACLAAVEALGNVVLSLCDSYKMLPWFDSIC